MHTDIFSHIQWNTQGLIPAIAQDAQTGDVLMMAWISKESLQATLTENVAVYWSRSRQKLWRKGETSGNIQKIKHIRLDCDGDTLLLLVDQIGDIACHTGRRSCFYREYRENEQATDTEQGKGQWLEVAPVLKDPKDLYS